MVDIQTQADRLVGGGLQPLGTQSPWGDDADLLGWCPGKLNYQYPKFPSAEAESRVTGHSQEEGRREGLGDGWSIHSRAEFLSPSCNHG